LLQTGLFCRDHVIWQHDGKRLVADQAARAPDRMAKAKRAVLTDVGDLARIHVGVLQCLKQLVFAFAAQLFLQLGGVVEIVF
jgi:hypothetical protein